VVEVHGNFELKIQNALTDKMKIVCCTEVPERIEELFGRAIEIIFPHIKPEKITVIFARKQFVISFSDVHVGIYVKNLIAFDLDKLEIRDDNMIIAAFLEEFVHCLLNISDEKEVGYRVSKIYPNVLFNGEKYLRKER